MTLTRFMRGQLHCRGEETILITGKVTFQQSNDVPGGCHEA
jgi:hypothetical protein